MTKDKLYIIPYVIIFTIIIGLLILNEVSAQNLFNQYSYLDPNNGYVITVVNEEDTGGKYRQEEYFEYKKSTTTSPHRTIERKIIRNYYEPVAIEF